MKLKIILSLLIMTMTVSTSYASFPVVRTVTTTIDAENAVEKSIVVESPAATVAGDKKLSTAILLQIFLGWPFAAHRWYLGSPVGWNILFIVTFAGVGIWWWFDFIDIVTENYPGL